MTTYILSSVHAALANDSIILVSSSVTGLLFDLYTSYVPLLDVEIGSEASSANIDSNKKTTVFERSQCAQERRVLVSTLFLFFFINFSCREVCVFSTN